MYIVGPILSVTINFANYSKAELHYLLCLKFLVHCRLVHTNITKPHKQSIIELESAFDRFDNTSQAKQ